MFTQPQFLGIDGLGDAIMMQGLSISSCTSGFLSVSIDAGFLPLNLYLFILYMYVQLYQCMNKVRLWNWVFKKFFDRSELEIKWASRYWKRTGELEDLLHFSISCA